jgi:branched-chain amino acid transport system permease protein
VLGLVGVWVPGFNFVQDPSRFLNVVIIGLTNGSVYALVALGYTLVYGILQLINFAHGDVFALGGLLSATFILDVFGVGSDSSATAIAAAVAGTLLVASCSPCPELDGGAQATAGYGTPRLAPLITAVGMSFILQNVGSTSGGRTTRRSSPHLHGAGVHDRRRRGPVGQPS